MGWALVAAAEPHHCKGWLKRFDPRYWTVDFARPMMASVTSDAPATLRVEAVFYRKQDLAGLIWEAEDRWDHPLLAYETRRDFRHTQLTFRWRSGGVKPLDALHGPTLTIEGRDASGAPRAWYVRLWNYAVGTGEDAVVSLDFDALVGGYLLPGEADPVWAGDVDRMFISLVPPTYDGGDGVLGAPAAGWAEMRAMACSGSGSVLAIGDVVMPEHALGMTGGYDDSYHLTPARVVRQIVQLGYRGDVVHYVGMSHYMRLEALGGGFYISLAGGVLNAPCAAWHAGFAAACRDAGLGVIWSLSYELFDAYCWNDWKQRAADGAPALTGWEPPSTLLSPANAAAMGYLQLVARAFVAIGAAAGLPPKFQVGEPWWWIAGGGRICAYDAAATAALGSASVAIGDVRGALSAPQLAMLDALGALLAASTAALVAAARDEASNGAGAAGLVSHLLVYLPTVLDPAAPAARRANVPLGWAAPAFDVLQLEDYDWVTGGRGAETAGARAAMVLRLGYPIRDQHYFSGFVLLPEQRAGWAAIADAADAARRAGVARAFVWALPQVARDGFVTFDGEGDVQAFDAVDFPLAIGREAMALTEFSTQIVSSPSGHEQRASEWAEARMRYDAGPGIRSEADVRTLADFFRARRGAARGFRFRDPFDDSSAADGGLPAATDQMLGTGDGTRRQFALVKRYGAGGAEQVRAIRLPVADSVRVSVDGIETAAFLVTGAGEILLDAAPAAGAGGGRRGARGLSVRCAGAFCRRPAGGEPRDLSGGRDGERAADRGAGAMVMERAPDWLREELVTLAWCWRLARRDGVVIGLTSHDRDLMVDGILYRAAPGMKPSALETSDSLDAATMDLEGAIASDAIAARDLDAGRWDGAELELFATDWSAPEMAPVTVARGSLGAIERRGAAFAAELQGVTRLLDRPVCPATSPSCRAVLGDRACRVDLAAHTHIRRVVAVDGRRVTLDADAPGMAFGELVWLDGANCGLASPVIAVETAVLHLAEAPAFVVTGPVRVRLTEGCDKQLATCRDRFANAINFRGEAHLPGNDLLTRYPGG